MPLSNGDSRVPESVEDVGVEEGKVVNEMTEQLMVEDEFHEALEFKSNGGGTHRTLRV